jgi:hypothetical protein
MINVSQLRAGRSRLGGVGLGVVLVGLAGCSPKQAMEVFPPASSRDAIQRARDILSLYAGGQPVGSESVGFEVMVEEVSKIDAADAALLERGFAELTARPAAARTIATKLLEQLPASAATAGQAPKPAGSQ